MGIVFFHLFLKFARDSVARACTNSNREEKLNKYV